MILQRDAAPLLRDIISVKGKILPRGIMNERQISSRDCKIMILAVSRWLVGADIIRPCTTCAYYLREPEGGLPYKCKF